MTAINIKTTKAEMVNYINKKLNININNSDTSMLRKTVLKKIYYGLIELEG